MGCLFLGSETAQASGVIRLSRRFVDWLHSTIGRLVGFMSSLQLFATCGHRCVVGQRSIFGRRTRFGLRVFGITKSSWMPAWISSNYVQRSCYVSELFCGRSSISLLGNSVVGGKYPTGKRSHCRFIWTWHSLGTTGAALMNQEGEIIWLLVECNLEFFI